MFGSVSLLSGQRDQSIVHVCVARVFPINSNSNNNVVTVCTIPHTRLRKEQIISIGIVVFGVRKYVSSVFTLHCPSCLPLALRTHIRSQRKRRSISTKTETYVKAQTVKAQMA